MTINLLFIALTIGTVGKVLLGLAVLGVHGHIVREHKIDERVLTAMRREKTLSIAGILFIISGYVLEVLFYNAILIM